jgi:hypothetical protein
MTPTSTTGKNNSREVYAITIKIKAKYWPISSFKQNNAFCAHFQTQKTTSSANCQH